MDSVSPSDPDPARPSSRRRAAWVVGALVLSALVADAVYRAGPKQRTDLPVYLAGSARLLAGEDPLYARSSRGWPYVYPPTLAVLVAPLGALPIRAAAGLWCVISLGVLGLGLRRWARQELRTPATSGEPPPPSSLAPDSPAPDSPAPDSPAPDSPAPDSPGPPPPNPPPHAPLLGDRLRWELWLPLLLVSLPLCSALLRGQVGPILLGLGLWAWCDLRAERDLRAGVLLALCAAIKLTPLLVIAGLCLARRWRAVVGAGLGGVLFLVLLPLPLLGPSGTAGALQSFGERMILRPLRDPGGPNMTSNLTHVPQNQALTSLAGRHLEGAPRLAAFAALALLVVLALVRSAYRLDLSAYGLLWGVPLLVAPVAWHHHHVVLFFSLALLAAERARKTLALFALLALLHFALKPLRPFGLLALGTLVVLGLSGWPRSASHHAHRSR